MDARDPEQLTTYPNGKPASKQAAWRQDFPVDVPEDHYVARRDFTKFMVLTSFAFVVGQFWIIALNVMRGMRGLPPAQRIGKIADIPVGTAVPFNYPTETDSCLLMRTAPETFVAFSQKCTHLSCAVIPDLPNGKLLCPCHHGVFDAATGRPLAGPPRRPLPRITLENRNGEIFATGVEVSA
jgi:nitrite reductase/ring-hydroxylating ferredoxin subunit